LVFLSSAYFDSHQYLCRWKNFLSCAVSHEFAKNVAAGLFECQKSGQRLLKIQGTVEPVRNRVWLARSAVSRLRWTAFEPTVLAAEARCFGDGLTISFRSFL
jgi:hypothetical protein